MSKKKNKDDLKKLNNTLKLCSEFEQLVVALYIMAILLGKGFKDLDPVIEIKADDIMGVEFYYNGKYTSDIILIADKLKKKQYKIVYGYFGIGKTLYIKSRSKYDKDILYMEANRLDCVRLVIRKNAIDIIEIKSHK